jgi:uncharacterized protein (TIGR02594 family)
LKINLKLAAGAAVAAVALGLVGAAAGTATPVDADVRPVAASKQTDAPAQVRDKIVDIGSKEVGKKRSVESGDNCNYYSRDLGAGCQEWCADFARWTWGKAGVDTGGLTAGAASFATYGRNHKSWHPGSDLKGVKPGDVIVYNLNSKGTWASHVAIVRKVDKKTGKISIVSGNSSNRVSFDELTRGNAKISGYVRPQAKKATTGKGTTKPTAKKSAEKPAKTTAPKPDKSKKPDRTRNPEPITIAPAQIQDLPGGA